MELSGRFWEYKQATNNFLRWLSESVPPPFRRVDEIFTKAQQLVGTDVPSHIFSDLCTCVRIRKEVQRMYVKRSTAEQKDRRHEYFISVLTKVRALLRPSCKRDARAEPAAGPKASENAFEQLDTSEDELEQEPLEDVGRMEGMLVQIDASQGGLNGRLGIVQQVLGDVCVVSCQGEVHRVPQAHLQAVGDEERAELLGETASFQAACFLLDLEELQQEVAKVWHEYVEQQHSLPVATAVTNYAVRYCSHLAAGMEVSRPELDSIERVVVAAYFLHIVQWMQQELRSGFKPALGLVTELIFGDPQETHFSPVPHGALLGLAQLGIHHGPELQRARQRIVKQQPALSAAQVDRIIDVVAESCCKRFFHLPKSADHPEIQGLGADDFLVGSNGFIHTSGFLRCLSNAKLIRPPKMFHFFKPDFFGPQWNEETNPASRTSDLISYAGAAVPALLWYVRNELRTSESQQLEVPDLKLDTLMPLWPLLRDAMEKGHTTLPLAFSLHAMLLSLVKVNGARRCKRIAVSCRSCFTRFAEQLKRDQKHYDHATQRRNLTLGKLWVDEVNKRFSGLPPGSQESEFHEAVSSSQRDYALLLNPWVAGQQELVALLAVAIGFGASIADSRGQIRFVLHLYNALRCTQQIQLPLLDKLLEIFATSKAIWHAGRPTHDFMQHWFLSMGMAVSSERGSRKQRALIPLDPTELSSAYRRVAASKFQDLPCRRLRDVLKATVDSFDDPLLRLNLIALGAHFRQLPEELVAALNLEAEVLKELQSQPAKAKPGKKKQKDSEDGATKRLNAIHSLLASRLLFACDTPEAVADIAAKVGYKHPGGEAKLEREVPELRIAAEVLTVHVNSLQAAMYTLPS